jgi:hypothetical protein
MQQMRNLIWARDVLRCNDNTICCFGLRLYKVAGRLDSMLLTSLGVLGNMDQVAMLFCLWTASKLEGNRRTVAAAGRLANALQQLQPLPVPAAAGGQYLAAAAAAAGGQVAQGLAAAAGPGPQMEQQQQVQQVQQAQQQAQQVRWPEVSRGTVLQIQVHVLDLLEWQPYTSH